MLVIVRRAFRHKEITWLSNTPVTCRHRDTGSIVRGVGFPHTSGPFLFASFLISLHFSFKIKYKKIVLEMKQVSEGSKGILCSFGAHTIVPTTGSMC